MVAQWQEMLYPLGLISSIFFTSRVFYQWTISEKMGRSVSPKGFWILSIAGNSVHIVHSLIQMQLPLALSQAFQIVIGHRNLNLLKPKEQRFSIQRVGVHFFLALLTTLGLFLGLCYLVGEVVWMRVPVFPLFGIKQKTPSLFLQMIGLLGTLLYALRFWIQWITIEKKGVSCFSPLFWILSLSGALLSSLYFLAILDWINILGTLFTLIPYTRNLLLLRGRKQAYE